jgi:hypothetical protein
MQIFMNLCNMLKIYSLDCEFFFVSRILVLIVPFW